MNSEKGGREVGQFSIFLGVGQFPTFADQGGSRGKEPSNSAEILWIKRNSMAIMQKMSSFKKFELTHINFKTGVIKRKNI